jgi:hypothetical protein
MAIKKIIEIDVNTVQAIGGLDNLSKALNKVDASAKGVDATFEEVYGDLKPLTARMGEAEDRLYELALAGQSASKEYQDLLISVSNYRKTQMQTDMVVDASASTFDTKLGGALQGAASAFAGVQGAMALTGMQSKELEEAILKVQGAMALAEGVRGIREGITSFKALGLSAKTALEGIKSGVAATGIGLFLIALGTVVAYWDDISKAIGGANEEQKAYQNTQEEVTKTLAKTEENLISVKIALDQAKQGTLSKKDALKLYNEKLGESLGKTDSLAVAEERLSKNTASFINSQMAKAQAQIFLAKASEAAAKAASGEDAELGWWDKAQVAIAQYGNAAAGATKAAELSIKNIAKNQKEVSFYTDLATKQYKKAAEEDNKINADSINTRYDAQKKAAEEAAAKAKADAEKAREDAKAKRKQQIEDEKEFLATLTRARLDNVAEEARQKYDAASIQMESLNQIAIVGDALEEEFLAKKDERAKKELEIERLKYEGKVALARKTSEMLGVFSDLLGKETAEGKALAIAQATINAYLGISEVWKAENIYPEPWGTATKIASTAVIAASAFKTVKDIAAVQVPGGGGGSAGSAPAGGGSAPAAPSFNVVGAGGTSQLAQVMNNKGMPPVQAYVVASNVTSAQSLNRNIVNNATLG